MAYVLTTCQTTFSVIPSPHVVPDLGQAQPQFRPFVLISSKFSSHVEAASKTAIHENAEDPLGRVDSGGTIAVLRPLDSEATG